VAANSYTLYHDNRNSVNAAVKEEGRMLRLLLRPGLL
jgi:hypothetical protein